MPPLRRLATPLLVVVALVASVTLATAPAAAQNGIKVFVVSNAMVNDEDSKERWQMRFAVRATEGCTPTEGSAEYASPWLDTGSELGVSLSLDECIFRISATMREAGGRTDCWYAAQLTWLDDNRNPVGDAATGVVFTTARPDGATRLSVVRQPGSSCAFPTEKRFFIDGGEAVEALPAPSADAGLRALARRAAESTVFDVRIRPDYPSGQVPAGCDDTADVKVRGDGVRVGRTLDILSGGCRFRASVVGAPAPFEVFEGASVAFTDADRIVDLSSLVSLPHARIAIIQDVRGSASSESVSYVVNRACAGVNAASDRTTDATSTLHLGRYTVHAPGYARYGAVATYPVGAADADPGEVVGCSVRVAIAGVPAGCAVDGAHTRTLTWSAADPVRNFDFEFDITCGAAPPPTTTAGPTGDEPAGAPAATGGELRITARRLDSGRVEFALQQRIDGVAWGERLLPAQRFFPTGATVDRWLVSSPLTVAVAPSADDFAEDLDVRIVARRRSNGKIEFGLQVRHGETAWGERLLPARRFFPADALVGRWLLSSAQDVANS